jgi:tetratricopeptide (TPR) repeat protein
LSRACTGALVCLVVTLSACVADNSKQPLSSSAMAGAPAGAPVAEPVMSKDGMAALNAGNEAIRRKDYAAAQAQFEKARALDPQNAAPWFGIYMAAQARKDSAAADAALVEIRKRSPASPAASPSAAPAMAGSLRGDTAAMRRAHEQAGVKVPPR